MLFLLNDFYFQSQIFWLLVLSAGLCIAVWKQQNCQTYGKHVISKLEWLHLNFRVKNWNELQRLGKVCDWITRNLNDLPLLFFYLAETCKNNRMAANEGRKLITVCCHWLNGWKWGFDLWPVSVHWQQRAISLGLIKRSVLTTETKALLTTNYWTVFLFPKKKICIWSDTQPKYR